MFTLVKIAVINLLVFLLVVWLTSLISNEKGVSLNTRAFIGLWWLVTVLFGCVTFMLFIWNL